MKCVEIIINVYLFFEDMIESLWRMMIATSLVVCLGWIFQKENLDLGMMYYFMNFMLYWTIFTFVRKLIVGLFKLGAKLETKIKENKDGN